MTKLNLSVIICAHNPRKDYLEQALQALKTQSIPQDLWELLLIDNASDVILASEVDLEWHSNARHVREETLGLTPARLRGIQEVSAEILVFVDDDNVLDIDYLKTALKIGEDSPFLGAWGGQIQPEFEAPPPGWTKPYWWMLALREFDRDQWSNLTDAWNTIPCGAGLCVRHNVAQRYSELVRSDEKRMGLDRKGKQLTSCGDLDLAITSHDFNLGTGQFPALKLTHLLPEGRFQESYLLKLAEANAYSSPVLESFRGKLPTPPIPLSWRGKWRDRYHRWRMNPRERRFRKAFERGRSLALEELLGSRYS